MNETNDATQGKRDKSSRNMLAYFGKRQFSVIFLVLYILGVEAIFVILNLLFEGGSMTAYKWWFSGIAGLLAGTGMYFWDLKKAQKSD